MSGSLHFDRHWPRASHWLAGECLQGPRRRVALLGAPCHLGSITPGRCDLAPGAIRRALERFSTYDVEHGVDVRLVRADDLGDLPIEGQTPKESFAAIREGAAEARKGADAVALMGGDNSITRPGLHGLDQTLKECGLITLDAHFDLRDLEAGLTNGNPVRALLEDGLPGENIAQIGIQGYANSGYYAAIAREAGVRVVTAEQAHRCGLARAMAEQLAELSRRVTAIYVDVDLDVLDRAFSPGTPGSRPGGFAVWELREAVWVAGACPQVKAMDLVEVDPERDVADATTLAAAACLLEFASGMVTR
ncbi:MAG TPA: agmatinase family protein [Bryobacteraceae bacterium]|nr:agmatinase family protein [Bryobacteraceae bacterium]